MAATLESPPSSPGYHRDHNFVTIQTDLIELIPATVHLDWVGNGPTIGAELTLEWAGNSITFTIAAGTNAQATDIPAWNGSETLAALVDRVTEAFRQNDQLTTDFEVVRGGTIDDVKERVSFVQRVPGPVDIVVDSGWLSASPDRVEHTVSDGENPASEENLAAYLQVFEQDDTDPTGNNDTRIVSLHAPYNVQNAQAIFDLKDLFPLDPALPDTDSIGPGNPSTWHNGVGYGAWAKYYLRYADKYGIPATSEALLKSSSYYMLHGGRPGDYISNIPSAVARLLHGYTRADGGDFRKPVHCMQPDWVYLFPLVDLEGCRVDLEITWSETTVTVEEVTSSTWILAAHQVHWLASGPLQHNIGDWVPPAAGAKPVAYTWRLYADAGEGEELIVSVDYDIVYHPWQYFLLMDNGVGGCESVLFSGKTTWKYTAERDAARRPRWTDYSVQRGEMFDFNQEGQQVIELNTGWYPLYYIEHVRQLLLGALWIIDAEKERFLRVVCDSKEIEVNEDDKQLFSLAITIRAAWFDTNIHL